MLLNKWNYETHQYEPFESPAKVAYVYSADTSAAVDCAQCGQGMTFGQGYTSKTIHSDVGFGYPVCESCYNNELKEEDKHRGI